MFAIDDFSTGLMSLQQRRYESDVKEILFSSVNTNKIHEYIYNHNKDVQQKNTKSYS